MLRNLKLDINFLRLLFFQLIILSAEMMVRIEFKNDLFLRYFLQIVILLLLIKIILMFKSKFKNYRLGFIKNLISLYITYESLNLIQYSLGLMPKYFELPVILVFLKSFTIISIFLITLYRLPIRLKFRTYENKN